MVTQAAHHSAVSQKADTRAQPCTCKMTRIKYDMRHGMHVQAQAHSTQVGPLREGTFDACTLYTPDRCGRQPSIKEAKKPRGATAAGTVWPRSNSKCAQAPQVAPKKQAAPLSTRAAGPAPENPKPSTAVKPAAGPRKGHYGSYVHTHLNVRAGGCWRSNHNGAQWLQVAKIIWWELMNDKNSLFTHTNMHPN